MATSCILNEQLYSALYNSNVARGRPNTKASRHTSRRLASAATLNDRNGADAIAQRRKATATAISASRSMPRLPGPLSYTPRLTPNGRESGMVRARHSCPVSQPHRGRSRTPASTCSTLTRPMRFYVRALMAACAYVCLTRAHIILCWYPSRLQRDLDGAERMQMSSFVGSTPARFLPQDWGTIAECGIARPEKQPPVWPGPQRYDPKFERLSTIPASLAPTIAAAMGQLYGEKRARDRRRGRRGRRGGETRGRRAEGSLCSALPFSRAPCSAAPHSGS